MRIKEVTRRHRNDFHWEGECEHCGHIEHHGDGYADHFYCTVVVPHRHCSKCDLNSYGESHEDRAIALRRAETQEARRG